MKPARVVAFTGPSQQPPRQQQKLHQQPSASSFVADEPAALSAQLTVASKKLSALAHPQERDPVSSFFIKCKLAW